MKYTPLAVGLVLCLSASPVVSEEGDVALGARAFRACAACHSVEANRNMTGPSLAGIWNRQAGSLPSFPRYSDVMKSSGVVWNDKTLDEYLKNPSEFMPGNHMTFPGVPDEKIRSGIIAFLKQPDKTQADRLVSQIALDRARIDALIGQLVTASMAQHVRMNFHIEARSLSRAFDHCLKTPRRKRCAALAHKDEGRSRRLPFQSTQSAQFTSRQGMRRRTTLFDSADVQDAAF
jgi:cytochrome c2